MPEKELFDEWPERYEQWFTTPIGKLVREVECRLLFDLLEPKPGETIFDAGCGTGVFTLDFVNAGARVVGLDISAPMLSFALIKTSGGSLSAVQGDIRHLPFKDNLFDKVTSITTLEFVGEADQAVDELFRVAKPGGRIVVATLNSLSPWAARRREKTQRGQRHILENAFYRSPGEILALREEKGMAGTAVHFSKDEALDRALTIERAGRAQGLDTGAFVAVRWDKPR